MSEVFFLGDVHGGHKKIADYRRGMPWTNEEEHYAQIKENYHKVVTKRDKVYFLGDIAFTKERLADIGTWAGQEKILVLGNHDLERGIHIRDVVEVFDEVHAMIKYKEFWLTHAPIHPLELRGRLSIHGHVHFDSIPDPRYLNVSLENINYFPITLGEVRKHFEELKEEVECLNVVRDRRVAQSD